jgi:hypothetical protein
MAYVTVGQAMERSRRSWSNSAIAESEIRKSARTSEDTSFDVFLSHSYKNAEVIAGIEGFLEDQGQIVYVDWINNPEADRSRVTPATADMLRHRMRHCQFLLYASSDEAKQSRWMPWELGYFDGMKPDHVGIVPIVASENDTFSGQEYLGLYPHFELINITAVGLRLAMDIDSRSARLIKSAVRFGTSRT